MHATDDLDQLARRLQRMVSGIGAPGTLERVDEGYGATILRSAGGIAMRIPKSARAGARQQALVAPLQRLARLLPVPIPLPLWSLPPAEPFPFGVAGYSWLAGAPPERLPLHSDLAEQVGGLLAAMHALDADTVTTFQSSLPDRAAVDAERERVVRVALPWLRERHQPAAIQRLVRWWDDYRVARDRFRYTPRLVHGDLWHGNLLVDRAGRRLTGVLDWENVCIDDPAQDFATLMHARDGFTELAMRAYERAGGTIDPALRERRRWHWEYRELTGIALALDAGDEAEAMDASRKLRAGALARLFDDAEEPRA